MVTLTTGTFGSTAFRARLVCPWWSDLWAKDTGVLSAMLSVRNQMFVDGCVTEAVAMLSQ